MDSKVSPSDFVGSRVYACSCTVLTVSMYNSMCLVQGTVLLSVSHHGQTSQTAHDQTLSSYRQRSESGFFKLLRVVYGGDLTVLSYHFHIVQVKCSPYTISIWYLHDVSSFLYVCSSTLRLRSNAEQSKQTNSVSVRYEAVH